MLEIATLYLPGEETELFAKRLKSYEIGIVSFDQFAVIKLVKLFCFLI